MGHLLGGRGHNGDDRHPIAQNHRVLTADGDGAEDGAGRMPDREVARCYICMGMRNLWQDLTFPLARVPLERESSPLGPVLSRALPPFNT